MSESRSFPPQEEISEAYGAVLATNHLMELGAVAAEDLKNAPWPLSPEARLLLREFDANELWKKENENINALDKEHGKVLSFAGINLVISDTLGLHVNPPPIRPNRIVPEMQKPDRFVAYLGHIGVESVKSDYVHLELAEDVIRHIYDSVCNQEAIINVLQDVQPINFETEISKINNSNAVHLASFRAVMPFYFNAGFHAFIPAYVELEKRLLAEPG